VFVVVVWKVEEKGVGMGSKYEEKVDVSYTEISMVDVLVRFWGT
jgi:hypothetical protein